MNCVRLANSKKNGGKSIPIVSYHFRIVIQNKHSPNFRTGGKTEWTNLKTAKNHIHARINRYFFLKIDTREIELNWKCEKRISRLVVRISNSLSLTICSTLLATVRSGKQLIAFFTNPASSRLYNTHGGKKQIMFTKYIECE